MIKSILFIFIVLSLNIFPTSCCKNIKSNAFQFNVIIPIKEDIGVDKDKLKSLLTSKVGGGCKSPDLVVELIIYSFSSGKEIFSVSKKNPDLIKKSMLKGYVKALIKIKMDGKLMKIHFLKITERNKDNIIKILIYQTEQILRQKYSFNDYK